MSIDNKLETREMNEVYLLLVSDEVVWCYLLVSLFAFT